jgi:hypothetical protein
MTDLEKRIKELEAKHKANKDGSKNVFYKEAFSRAFDALWLAFPHMNQLHALNARLIAGQSTPDDKRALDQLQVDDLALIELTAEELVEMICELDLAY